MQRLETASKFLLALTATAFLFISGIMAPPAGIVLLPLVPQPALSFGLRFGAPSGIGVTLAAAALFLLIAGEELALIYGLFGLVVALLFALLGRVRAVEYLVFGVASAVYAAAGALLFYFYGSWSAMVRDFRASMTENFAAAVQIQERMGLPKESIDALREQSPEIVGLLLYLLPALLFVAVGVVVLLNFFLLWHRFPERREQWFAVETLREWKAPEPLVWGFIACGFSLFLPVPGVLKALGANLLVVIAACYFFQGLAIVAFFFDKNRVPRFFRGVTYLFIAFQQIFTFLVIGLGLFDLWIDFRRLRKKNLKPSQVS
ncbi:MAG TPA: DUF2232 domain-containing protein [candidate division Zixibacteria bacterium]|nr:DUF2232 domain-containing protein [candidate division Zixibacteria bacterium]